MNTTKTIVFSFFFLTTNFLAFGQDVHSLNKSIDLVAGVNYSYRTLGGEGLFAELENDKRDEEEKASITKMLGLHLNLPINNRWIFRSGVRFAKMGYQTRLEEAFYPNGRYSPGGIERSPEYRWVTTQNQYAFLEVPATFRYQLFDKKVIGFVEFGIAANYLLNIWENRMIDGENKATKNDRAAYKALQLSGLIGLGIEKRVNNRLGIFGQAGFYHQLSNGISDGIYREYLYQWSLELGARMYY